MMPQKDHRFRSPLRVFEKAIEGGVGRGNIGVVLSRPGVGKTAFLVGVAVDALLQGRKVMHISTEESVEKMRAFYDEIFNLLVENLQLENSMQRRIDMERNRQLLVFNRKDFSLEKLEQSASFLRDIADFEPDVLIMDGTPRFEKTERWEVEGVRELAKKWNTEIWTASKTHREGQDLDERGVPAEVARYDDILNVIIFLEPEGDHVRVRILKDHDQVDAPDVQMELDPKTLLLRWR
jgi:hypothetical protein